MGTHWSPDSEIRRGSGGGLLRTGPFEYRLKRESGEEDRMTQVSGAPLFEPSRAVPEGPRNLGLTGNMPLRSVGPDRPPSIAMPNSVTASNAKGAKTESAVSVQFHQRGTTAANSFPRPSWLTVFRSTQTPDCFIPCRPSR